MAVKKKKAARGPKQYGFTAAEVAAAKAAQGRSESSTPRAIVDAFAPDRTEIGGFTLQPCMASTIILLTKTGSALLKGDEAAEFPLEDVFRALFIFSRPIDEVRDIISRGGMEAAVHAITDIFPPAHIPALAAALNTRIVEAFSTLVPHGAKGEGEGSGNFPETPEAATGTAGR